MRVVYCFLHTFPCKEPLSIEVLLSQSLPETSPPPSTHPLFKHKWKNVRQSSFSVLNTSAVILFNQLLIIMLRPPQSKAEDIRIQKITAACVYQFSSSNGYTAICTSGIIRFALTW